MMQLFFITWSISDGKTDSHLLLSYLRQYDCKMFLQGNKFINEVFVEVYFGGLTWCVRPRIYLNSSRDLSPSVPVATIQ